MKIIFVTLEIKPTFISSCYVFLQVGSHYRFQILVIRWSGELTTSTGSYTSPPSTSLLAGGGRTDWTPNHRNKSVCLAV